MGFIRSAFSLFVAVCLFWCIPLLVPVLFVRVAVQVASALSSAVQVDEEHRREEFVSSRGLLAAIEDELEKDRRDAANAQGVLAPLPHCLSAPKTKLELDNMAAAGVGKPAIEEPLKQAACAEHTGDQLEAHTTEPADMRISLQDACTDHNSTDQAVVVTLKITNKKTTTDETTEQPTKTAEETDIDNQENAEEAPNQEIPNNQEHPKEPPTGSWGDIIGNGWPAFVAHEVKCFSLLTFPMTKTHITLEVGLCGCLLTGDNTGSRVTFFNNKTPKNAVMGDQLELAVEAVRGANGRFSYNYHLLEHRWAAPHADQDLPATPCHEIQRARQYAIKIARISADCW